MRWDEARIGEGGGGGDKCVDLNGGLGAERSRQPPKILAARLGSNRAAGGGRENDVRYFFLLLGRCIGTKSGFLHRDGTSRTDLSGVTACWAAPAVTGSRDLSLVR